MHYTVHGRSNRGVYRQVSVCTTYKEAFQELCDAATINRLSRYWISLDDCRIPHPRLFEFDPDHYTLEDLVALAD